MPETMTQHQIWTLSGPALLLYVAAAAIFLAVQSINFKVAEGLSDAFKARKPHAPFLVLLLSALSNFIGAATLVVLSRTSDTSMRLSMIVPPLLLVAGRYAQAARAKEGRSANLSGLFGSVAGMLAGAWVLIRPAVSVEPIARAVVSGQVQTATVGQVLANPDKWAVSVQLVVFYCVALAIFFGAHHALKLALGSASMTRDLREGKPAAFAQALLAALGLNFFGGAAFAFASNSAGVPPRLAMVAFPAFLIVESYTRQLRETETNRRGLWCGLVGSAAGITASVLLLMKGAPLH